MLDIEQKDRTWVLLFMICLLIRPLRGSGNELTCFCLTISRCNITGIFSLDTASVRLK
jgi:hypothetical protein